MCYLLLSRLVSENVGQSAMWIKELVSQSTHEGGERRKTISKGEEPSRFQWVPRGCYDDDDPSPLRARENHGGRYYNCDGEVVVDGVTLGTGSTGAADVCLPPSDGGYGVVVGGGWFSYEVGWTLLDPTNATILSGSAGTFSSCDSHFGCTSAGAANYNPAAIIDDGSCDHTQYCNYESFDYDDGASVTAVAADFTCWSGHDCSNGAEVTYIENGAMRINQPGQDVVSNWPEVTSGQYYSCTSRSRSKSQVEGRHTTTWATGRRRTLGLGSCRCTSTMTARATSTHRATAGGHGYGDGWNCASATITDCEGNVLAADVALPSSSGAIDVCDDWTQHAEGTLGYGDICLPAVNLTITFTSGSWDNEIGWSLYGSDGTVGLVGDASGASTCPPTPCEGNEHDLHMTETTSLSISDCAGNVIHGSVVPSADDGYTTVCLPESEDGVVIEASATPWWDEASWTLFDSAGEMDLTGGSGVYASCHACAEDEYDFHMTDDFGDGWNCYSATITDCEGNVLAADVALPSSSGAIDVCDDWTQHEGGSFGYGDTCIPATTGGYTVTFTTEGNFGGEIGWSLIANHGGVELSGGASGGPWTTCPDQPPSDECADTDAGATDPYGDSCAAYVDFPGWCGGYDDDDFDSMVMCCACGGGSDYVAPPPEPAPEPAPPPPPCWDTDAGATDPYGDSCAAYVDFPGWCGNYDDDDFDSMVMCCACGGGSDTEPPPPPTCWDTDFGAVDPYGDSCAAYVAFPGWCGNYDDDDFDSAVMCCACGGGVVQDTEPEPPPPPPPPPPCWDTDFGALDPYGDSCAAYVDFPYWCGLYDDDDFDSAVMCCACGGGVVQDTEPEPPPPPP
eukprot:COSAG05_NODE_873_length_6834_cov_14.862422_1_plen_847_part_10